MPFTTLYSNQRPVHTLFDAQNCVISSELLSPRDKEALLTTLEYGAELRTDLAALMINSVVYLSKLGCLTPRTANIINGRTQEQTKEQAESFMRAIGHLYQSGILNLADSKNIISSLELTTENSEKSTATQADGHKYRC